VHPVVAAAMIDRLPGSVGRVEEALASLGAMRPRTAIVDPGANRMRSVAARIDHQALGARALGLIVVEHVAETAAAIAALLRLLLFALILIHRIGGKADRLPAFELRLRGRILDVGLLYLLHVVAVVAAADGAARDRVDRPQMRRLGV